MFIILIVIYLFSGIYSCKNLHQNVHILFLGKMQKREREMGREFKVNSRGLGINPNVETNCKQIDSEDVAVAKSFCRSGLL